MADTPHFNGGLFSSYCSTEYYKRIKDAEYCVSAVETHLVLVATSGKLMISCDVIGNLISSVRLSGMTCSLDFMGSPFTQLLMIIPLVPSLHSTV